MIVRRTSLTLSILLILFAGGVWGEQKICTIDTVTKSINELDIIEKINQCEVNDILYWDLNGYVPLPQFKDLYTSKPTRRAAKLIADYCHQEKQITTSADLSIGVCTFVKSKKERNKIL